MPDPVLATTFGQIPFATIKALYDELRTACRAEGTPRIQAAIDAWEPVADAALMRMPLALARLDLCGTCAQPLGWPHVMDCPYG